MDAFFIESGVLQTMQQSVYVELVSSIKYPLTNISRYVLD